MLYCELHALHVEISGFQKQIRLDLLLIQTRGTSSIFEFIIKGMKMKKMDLSYDIFTHQGKYTIFQNIILSFYRDQVGYPEWN